ncbi:MAG TPA: ribosome-associated translation inhibitor RaiA [Phycisphaerae bacterium]|nr:ribosome-associated translation inhibitor RaiA [Phycisphaerae bacterium]HNU46213.1 ribosome-associated translation inhibitor RaiA [Phycisphaerae bacterium]
MVGEFSADATGRHNVQITVTGRHVEVTEDVRVYALEKADKLPRYFDRVQSIEIVLGHESEQFTAEMIVRAEGKPPLVGREAGPDTFALIDLLVDKMERQLTRHKERARDHKPGT